MRHPKKFHIYVAILLIIFLTSGCATVPRGARGPSDKEVFLKDLCDRYRMSMQWDNVSQVVTLKFNDVKAMALAGSDVVFIEKESIQLSAPIRTVQSALVVPLDFERKVIERMRKLAGEGKPFVLRRIREIIVDAGHGGKDPGAIGRTGLREKEVVLDIAKRLKRTLQRDGMKVIMTRDKDEFIELGERTQIASRSRGDLFVSIHANSSPARNVQGLEVFLLRDLGALEKNEAQRKENHRLLFNNLAMENDSRDLENIIADMLYTHKQRESRSVATHLSTKTAKLAKIKNRGVKQSRFFVLRNTLIPAILVEVGFLSNPKEEQLLRTTMYRQRIAEALAESIMDYVNGR